MNRASRVSDKAGRGQVWVTESAWAWSTSHEAGLISALELTSSHLGLFNLKGIAEEVQIVQVSSE